MVDSLSNNVVARPGWQYCLGGDYVVDGLIVAGVGDFVIGIRYCLAECMLWQRRRRG